MVFIDLVELHHFFDVTVTHVNSKCNQQEEEKKRKYQQRVLYVEMGSFTPLVFGTNGAFWSDSVDLIGSTRPKFNV